MERKSKMGWGGLRIIGLIYTPLGAFFLVLGLSFLYLLPDVFPLGFTFSLLGGIFFLLGVVFLTVEYWEKKRMDALLEAERFVWAEVVDCVCNYGVRANGRHPYQVVACCETGGRKHLFRSQSLFIPAPHDLIGKSVRVYADADFKHYYVDVEPLLEEYVEH